MKDLDNLDGHNSNKEFTRIRYYEFARKEIEREDEITHKRLTSTLTFQGFLLAAMAVILSRWTPEGSAELTKLGYTQIAVLLALGLIGGAVALYSYLGVSASRISLEQARIEWETKNKLWRIHPDHAPQITGQNTFRNTKWVNTFLLGTSFSLAIPRLFIFMWALYIIFMASVCIGKLVLRDPSQGDTIKKINQVVAIATEN